MARGQRSNFNLPNALTVARIAAVPMLVYLLWQRRYEVSFWLFVIMAFSDLFDGLLARALNARTVLGANLDPLADKLTQLGGFISLAAVPVHKHTAPLIPLWLAALVVGRDLMITGGIAYLRGIGREVRIQPLLVGKVCTNVQFCTASAAILLAYLMTVAPQWPHIDYVHCLLWTLIAAAGVLTVWSGAAYFNWGLRILRAPERSPGQVR